MTTWAHTLVRNEERYIWYAVMSVIDHVDKILIWDTGSDDNTVKIIKEIIKLKPGKIELEEVGEVDIKGYTKARQEMLDRTKSEWVLILDGDEVWWDDSVFELVRVIKKNKGYLETIVSPMRVIVGDIYHYQEESAGKYEIDGKRGHLTIRAISRNIPGLHTDKPHGQHGYFDVEKRLIQKRDSKKRKFIDKPFLHFTHMPRSALRDYDKKVPKRELKLKYEIGRRFPLDFYYPEVFFRPRPSLVPSPWEVMSIEYKIKSALIRPIKLIKRQIRPARQGY